MVRVDVITSDSQFTVCEQGLQGYEITECKVTMQLNAVSSAVIKTPPTNTHIQPLTSGISPVVAIYDNERLEFIGSIASHKTDLWGNVEIQLDGALSWLSDIVKPPFTVTNKTHAEYINAIMTQYNAAMTENGTEERIVWFGGVVGFSGNVDIHHSDEYTNTLDLLREAVEMYGGYLFETFGDGVAHPAVGWIREPIIDSGVVIEFGVNELALESQLDFSDFATRVYAVGKTNSITYAASAPDLELEYGRRDYAIKTDAEDQNTLAAQAIAVLNARKIPVRTIEVTAAELGLMGQRADALEIGSTATLLDRKLGDDVVLMVNKIERDLIDRQNTRISLGRSPVTITGVVSSGGSSSSVQSSGGGAISMPDAVLFTPQNLTPSQKSIARNNIGAFDGEGIPTKTSELTNDSGFVTQATAAAAAPVQSVNGKTGSVVLKTSDLQNDSGYITSAPVASVNGKTGTVVLNADDVHAISETGNAYRSVSIPFGVVDDTSTATAFTASVPGITELRSGVCVMLMNGVVTSASGFTVNVNDLGAKPVYSTLAAATRATTLFNVAYTLLLVYNEERVSGGCWDAYYGYDSNTNTIGYQLRANSTTMPTLDKFYRYRLLFTSADRAHFVPANTSSSTNATATRAVNQRPIDPFGVIYYYGHTTAINSGANPTTSYMWTQYNFNLGYSFNRSGAALTLTNHAPVYIKCAPQSDGSAIIDADTPFVQTLPTTDDGKIYIHLGIASGAETVELSENHPVYYCKDNEIKVWTGLNPLADDAPVVTYAAQQLTDAQKAQARANIGAASSAAADILYDIYAEFRTDSAGNYYAFTGGVNAATILSALNSGMIPVVRNNDNVGGTLKKKWFFSEYQDDGEDVYIQFFRVTVGGVEVLKYTESERRAYISTIGSGLPNGDEVSY